MRRACGYVGLHPRTYRYRPIRPQDRHARLIERLEALSWKHPRYDYRRIRPARKLTGEDVLEVVKEAVREHGAPDHLRSDNGSEFIAHVVQDWFREHGIKTIYIAPGSPWQNGWIESFHARLRDECLNRELLLNLREARVVIEDFRRDYNQERSHSKLGYLSPNQWIEKQSSSPDSARPAGLAPSRLQSSENIN